MDVLDPLGTVDAVAPHTTSFSSNIYLLKKEHKSFTKGQLINLSKDLSPSTEEKLLFVVGKEIDSKFFNKDFSDSALARIFGYTVSFVNKKTVLVEEEGEVSFGRVYVVNENLEIDAVKISEWNGFEVLAKVGERGDREEEDGAWEVLEQQFGKSAELAYYWYLRTGKFYGEVTFGEAGSEEIEALEALDIPSLVKPKEAN